MYTNRAVGLAYISPFLIGLALFLLFPFMASLGLSFTDYRLQDHLGDARFIGLDNYKEMFADHTFRKSLWITVVYVLVTVPLKLSFALFIAFVLNFKLRGINFFRTAYYLPSILGGSVAIAVVWRYVYAGDGLINQALTLAGFSTINWMGDPSMALVTIILLRLWQFGSAMVVFLAGLQGISPDLYEAAKLDGAGPWRTFSRVTLPLLTPVVFFNFIMQSVQAFQEFNGPYVVTGGGPLKSTYLLPLMIYEEAFKYFELGYASAISWFLFALVAVITAIAFISQRYWVFYAQDRERAS